MIHCLEQGFQNDTPNAARHFVYTTFLSIYNAVLLRVGSFNLYFELKAFFFVNVEKVSERFLRLTYVSHIC